MIGIGIGIRPKYFGGLDSDAAAFISALAADGYPLEAPEQTYINTLVTDFKSAGIWSKMKAIYPYCTSQRNLIGYSEDFGNAAWTKQYGTVTTNTTTAPNGTNTADTFSQTGTDGRVVQDIYTSSKQIVGSIYVKGDASSIGKTSGLYIWRDGGSELNYISIVLTNQWQRISLAVTFTTTPSVITFRSDVLEDGNIGDSAYIWGAQLELGSTATTYQPVATTASTIFASQFKYNLKDPRNLDAAFRQVFNGGWTYSKEGATPNGTNGYSDTKLNPVSNGLTSASAHLAYYARTQATTSDPAEIANFTDITTAFVIQSKSSGGLNRFFYTLSNAASRVVSSAPIGLMMGSSVANTRRDLYLNGSSVANNTITDTGNLGNYPLYIGAGNISGSSVSSYTNSQCAFASIGNGLTSSEASALYTAVQNYQNSMSRAV